MACADGRMFVGFRSLHASMISYYLEYGGVTVGSKHSERAGCVVLRSNKRDFSIDISSSSNYGHADSKPTVRTCKRSTGIPEQHCAKQDSTHSKMSVEGEMKARREITLSSGGRRPEWQP